MSVHVEIPESVRRADQLHHAILQRVAFSQHLNPINATEARRAFLAGQHAPPFRYNPLQQADALLWEIDRIRPSEQHPAGQLVGRVLNGTALLVRALRDRTPSAFDALARHAGWYPDPDLLALRFPETPRDDELANLPAEQMVQTLQAALTARGLVDWRVERDTVMSARVLVDSAKRLLRVNPLSRFKSRDLRRLVAHEVDVHVMRAHNGQRQALRCFSTGLPGSLATEEGLALMAEERMGAASPGVLNRQAVVVEAIDLARTMGFREVYNHISQRHSPGLAWGVCLRIKRGLANPGEPGVYAKDSVYLRGRMLVHQWLADGNDVRHLYVGKVGVSDPVADWVAQGWLQPCEPPRMWQQHTDT